MADLTILLDPVQTHRAFLQRSLEDGQAAVGADFLRVRIAVEAYQYRPAHRGRHRKFQADGDQFIFNVPSVAAFMAVEKLVKLMMEQVAATSMEEVTRVVKGIGGR